MIQPENLYFKSNNHFGKSTDNQEVYQNNTILNLEHHDAMRQFESDYFLNLLVDQCWNMKETAVKAGITREWLSKKVKSLGLKSG